jgi:hypothetical protein
MEWILIRFSSLAQTGLPVNAHLITVINETHLPLANLEADDQVEIKQTCHHWIKRRSKANMIGNIKVRQDLLPGAVSDARS